MAEPKLHCSYFGVTDAKFYGRHHELVDHFLNDNGTFPFYVDYFSLFSHPQDISRTCLGVTWRVSYMKQELVILCVHLGSIWIVLWVHDAHFRFLSLVFCYICLRCDLCSKFKWLREICWSWFDVVLKTNKLCHIWSFNHRYQRICYCL